MRQINLEFKQNGAVWESDPVQMITPNAAIEYSMATSGKLSVQRGISTDRWYEMSDLDQSGQNGMFNISGGVNGMHLRFITSVKPNYISVVL